MNRIASYRQVLLLVLMMALAVGCAGRIRVGDLQTTSESVALEDAAEVDVEISMGFGNLTLGGGADGLMEGEFTYNVERWEPEVAYEVRGDTGYLRLEQPSTGVENLGIPDDDIRYEWDVRLAEDVPMEIEVQMGAGDGNLDLQNMDVQSLDMQTGAGDVSVSVGGTMTELDVEMGAGELRLSLDADWQQDLDAVIRSGVGQLTVLLPADTGVRVSAAQGLGNVNAVNLRQDGDDYVNDAFGETDATLDIRVEGGVGEIVLEVVE